MSQCYQPGCENTRTEGGFCDECRRAMRTPKMETSRAPHVDMTVCVCGRLAMREGLCALHFVWAWLKPFLQKRRIRIRLIAAIAILMLGFVLLACSDVGDGSCEPPAPCHSVQGNNP